MTFDKNHWIIFLLAGIVIAFVLAQSVFFLVKALKQSKKIGMDKKVIRKTVVTSAVFTIAPAVAIIISVITLSKSLGIPLPWLRLSVIGSLSYETVAANNALSAWGLKIGETFNMTASQFVTITLVMTISISVGIWLVAVLGKKLQKGMKSIENRDKKWSEIFSNAMFIGMISAFLGFVFCDFSDIFIPDPVTGVHSFAGLIPVLTMLAAAIIMIICGGLVKLTKARWIEDYALPISMIGGMASAIPLTAWLG